MKGTRRAVAVLNILCTAVLYGVLVLVVFVVVAIIIVLLKQLLPDLFSFVDEYKLVWGSIFVGAGIGLPVIPLYAISSLRKLLRSPGP